MSRRVDLGENDAEQFSKRTDERTLSGLVCFFLARRRTKGGRRERRRGAFSSVATCPTTATHSLLSRSDITLFEELPTRRSSIKRLSNTFRSSRSLSFSFLPLPSISHFLSLSVSSSCLCLLLHLSPHSSLLSHADIYPSNFLSSFQPRPLRTPRSSRRDSFPVLPPTRRRTGSQDPRNWIRERRCLLRRANGRSDDGMRSSDGGLLADDEGGL